MLNKFLDRLTRPPVAFLSEPVYPLCELAFRAELQNRGIESFESWALVNVRTNRIVRFYGSDKDAEKRAKRCAAEANKNYQILKLRGVRHTA